jgi:hypothetical protein
MLADGQIDMAKPISAFFLTIYVVRLPLAKRVAQALLKISVGNV